MPHQRDRNKPPATGLRVPSNFKPLPEDEAADEESIPHISRWIALADAVLNQKEPSRKRG